MQMQTRTIYLKLQVFVAFTFLMYLIQNNINGFYVPDAATRRRYKPWVKKIRYKMSRKFKEKQHFQAVK